MVLLPLRPERRRRHLTQFLRQRLQCPLRRLAGHPGGSNPNYAITFVPATFTIQPRPITVTAVAVTKVYGEQDPVLQYVITEGELVEGDQLIGSLSRTAGEDVDTYTILQGTLTGGPGGNNPNYAITFVLAVFTVTKAPLTVQAVSVAREYGQANPALVFVVNPEQFRWDDDESVLTGQLVTGATLTSPAGTYAITRGTLDTRNYEITFVDGTLTVIKAPLTVRANDAERLVGAEIPPFSVTYSGFRLGEDESALSGVLVITTSADLTSAPGTYLIIPAGLTSDNYEITFVPGTLVVLLVPRDIVVEPPQVGATERVREGNRESTGTVPGGAGGDTPGEGFDLSNIDVGMEDLIVSLELRLDEQGTVEIAAVGELGGQAGSETGVETGAEPGPRAKAARQLSKTAIRKTTKKTTRKQRNKIAVKARAKGWSRSSSPFAYAPVSLPYCCISSTKASSVHSAALWAARFRASGAS